MSPSEVELLTRWCKFGIGLMLIVLGLAAAVWLLFGSDGWSPSRFAGVTLLGFSWGALEVWSKAVTR